MTIEELDKQLQALRDKYVSHKGDKEIIIRQARALEMAKEKVQKRLNLSKSG